MGSSTSGLETKEKRMQVEIHGFELTAGLRVHVEQRLQFDLSRLRSG